MSTQHSEHEDFNVLSKWKPGSDLMNKLLLSDPKIINLIVRSLVGADAPPDSYSVAQTEWPDGSRSDLLYASQIDTLPPILIACQYYVNQDFMLRLIQYSSNVYRHYKMLPIVLAIVTKPFSKAKFQDEFTTSKDGFLLDASCKFWAKECFLLTADAVSTHFQQETLNPMAALGYFATHHTLSQIPQHHRSNPSILLLSSTVQEILSQDRNEMICKSGVTYLLNQIKRNLEDIIEESDDTEPLGIKKVKTNAKEGLLSIDKLESELEDVDNKGGEEESNTNTDTDKEAQFIKSLSKPGKRKNWREIFDKGKAKGFFKTYKSSETLKSSYYHIQRRKKDKK